MRAWPVLATAVVLAAALTAGATTDPALVTAGDGIDVESVLAASGVDTRPPRPHPARWVLAVGERAGSWLRLRLPRGEVLGDVLLELARWVGIAVLAAVLTALVLVVARILRRARPGSPPQPADGEVAATAARTSSASAELAWQDLEQALARGRTADALAALWRWLALTVSSTAPDPSWTTGDLLRHVGRPELRAPLAALDAMIYGPSRVAPDEVRRLAASLWSLA